VWAFPPGGWGISRKASPPSLCSSFVHSSNLSTPALDTALLCICCRLSLSCPFFTIVVLLLHSIVPKDTPSSTQLTVLIDRILCVVTHLPKHPSLGKHLSTAFSTTIQYIIMGPGMNSSKLLPYVKWCCLVEFLLT